MRDSITFSKYEMAEALIQYARQQGKVPNESGTFEDLESYFLPDGEIVLSWRGFVPSGQPTKIPAAMASSGEVRQRQGENA